MSGNRSAILAVVAVLAFAGPAGAQAARRGGGHPGGARGGGYHPGGGGHRGGSYAVPRGSAPSRPAYGGVAAARHPRPGGYYPGHGGYYPRHGGYYPPYHHGGYYRPYYYGYYRPYYPYASFYFGWPYYWGWGWPYYSPSYAVSYYAYPDRAWDAPPPDDSSRPRDPDRAFVAPRPLDPSRDEGRVRLEVRPEDASVYVDDEFQGSARETKFLNLRSGRHSIELVRPGFEIARRDVEVARGEASDVLVELRRP